MVTGSVPIWTMSSSAICSERSISPAQVASVDNHIVAAKYNNQIGLSFHPELTGDTRIHEYFLSTIK